MKNLLNKNINKLASLVLGLVALGVIYGCTEDLPGPGSMPDDTPPAASFSYASQADFLEIKFTNLSTEALSYEWDFGVKVEIPDSVLTAVDPTYTYAKVGEYEVTLTAIDGLGVVSDTTILVVVEEGPYQPVILEAQFEGDGATGDARDPWDAEWSTVIQITSDGALDADGNKTAGGKLPSDGARVAYQEIVVEAESNYDVSFVYTLTDAVPGSLTVEILDVDANGETFMTYEDTRDHVIGAVTLNDQDDPDTYVGGEVSFASGTSTKIAIMVSNSAGIEARFDNFIIEIGSAGAIPPSASFTVQQSETNYLEYTFTNTSLNGDTYSWDLGDGNTSTEESPTHTYEEAGEYTVSLVVTSEGGLTGDFSTSFQIHAPVTAAFTYEIDDDDYKTYSFMDASEDAVSLLWEFGDGFQYTGMDPIHTYELDGTYTVTLTATSLTGFEDVEEVIVTVAQGFVVQILNGTFDEYTFETGDNADAWDMTPNSTVIDNDGNTIDSPYDPLWDNSDLDSWLDNHYGDDSEQPGSSSDGNNDTRGAKLEEPSRRLYQVVTVEAGETYTFSIDSRTSGASAPTDVYILNTEIADETGINASDSDAAIDEYFEITNDFNTDSDVFTTSTFDFTPSTNKIVIYVRNVNVVDNVTEAWYDNITIE